MTRVFLTERIRQRLTRAWRRFSGTKSKNRSAAQRAFNNKVARLGPDDIVIDLGANIGDVSEVLAATGAQVIAFEPDPYAFGRLQDRLGHLPNVRLLNMAAAERDGHLPLYRHPEFHKAPEKRSLASSLLAEHANVASTAATNVEIRDFIAFLTDLNRDIALLKIDIEGAEVALMEALLDHPVSQRIDTAFVETHEFALPHLAQRTRALKARTAQNARPTINWDWH